MKIAVAHVSVLQIQSLGPRSVMLPAALKPDDSRKLGASAAEFNTVLSHTCRRKREQEHMYQVFPLLLRLQRDFRTNDASLPVFTSQLSPSLESTRACEHHRI